MFSFLRKKRVSFILTMLLSLAAAPQLLAKDDWEYWHETQLQVRLHDRLKWRVKGEHRLRDDFSDLFLNNLDTGLSWKASEHFEIGPYFKYEHEKDSRGNHINENRWYLEAVLKGNAGPLRLANRSRIAYRNKNTSDSWRYRNQFKVSHVLPVKKIIIEPFATEEIFWDLTAREYNQNRAALGVQLGLNKHMTVSLYYLLKSSKRDSDWDEAHVLGSTVTFSV